MLVDCDIHLGYRSLSDLVPYLDGATRELVVSSGTNGLAMPSYPWNHPTGWIRHDVYERGATSGDFPYVTLDVLRERHLDAFGVSLGIVEPDEAAAFSNFRDCRLEVLGELIDRGVKLLRGLVDAAGDLIAHALNEVLADGELPEFAHECGQLRNLHAVVAASQGGVIGRLLLRPGRPCVHPRDVVRTGNGTGSGIDLNEVGHANVAPI